MFRDLLLARKVQPIPVSLRTLAGADLIQTELVELVRAAVVGALEHYRSISSGQRLAPTLHPIPSRYDVVANDVGIGQRADRAQRRESLNQPAADCNDCAADQAGRRNVRVLLNDLG